MQYDETQRGEQIEPNQSQKATKANKKYTAVGDKSQKKGLIFPNQPSISDKSPQRSSYLLPKTSLIIIKNGYIYCTKRPLLAGYFHNS
jgi:hypothetical protein